MRCGDGEGVHAQGAEEPEPLVGELGFDHDPGDLVGAAILAKAIDGFVREERIGDVDIAGFPPAYALAAPFRDPPGERQALGAADRRAPGIVLVALFILINNGRQRESGRVTRRVADSAGDEMVLVQGIAELEQPETEDNQKRRDDRHFEQSSAALVIPQAARPAK